MQTRLTFSVADTADELGISRAKLYEEIQAGRIRSYRVGRRRFISAEAIRDYIRAQEAAAA